MISTFTSFVTPHCKMSDSDDDCYEQVNESLSPPSTSHPIKPRSNTSAGLPLMDSRKTGSRRSTLPHDIDNRPPCPIPKSALLPGNQLSYDRITVSPVAPDYEMSSASPPRTQSISIGGHHRDNRPPLPPINPYRKPPSRLV